MPTTSNVYSINEAAKPATERVYHDNSACGPLKEIPQKDRLYGTGGYRLCLDCKDLNDKGK